MYYRDLDVKDWFFSQDGGVFIKIKGGAINLMTGLPSAFRASDQVLRDKDLKLRILFPTGEDKTKA